MQYAKNSRVNKKVSKHFKEKPRFDKYFIPLRLEMPLKGGRGYFLRVIITTLQKSITTEINHTVIITFFFIGISFFC